MADIPDRGRLKAWKDDRGFGFIKPEGGGKDVFLHISALLGDCRCPQVGDTILYEKVTQPDGKIRAAKASIQGVVPSPLQTTTPISTTPRPRTAGRQPKQNVWLQALVGILGLTTVALFAVPLVYRTFLLSPVTSIPPSPAAQSGTTPPSPPVAQPNTATPSPSAAQPNTVTPPSPAAQPITTSPPPAAQLNTTTPLSPVEAVTEPNCMVKGNISISSGKKLYHVPGMEDYEGTEIHRDKGERWFCTEAEAIAAGWSRAPK